MGKEQLPTTQHPESPPEPALSACVHFFGKSYIAEDLIPN